MTNEEAIDILKCLAWHERRPDEEEIEQAIKTLERPNGKWVHSEQVNGLGGYWKCSCCGEPAIFTPRLDIDNAQIYSWDNSKTNFCPNCGADMRSNERERTNNG